MGRCGSSQLLATYLLICWCLYAGMVHGLPLDCTKNSTKPESYCCPVVPGYGTCGGPGRGACHRVASNQELYQPRNPELQNDDRLDWPHHFFDFACRCEKNFFGPFCIQCRFGFQGAECEEKVVRVRKNVMKMTDAEKAEFRRVLTVTKQTVSPLNTIANVWDVDPNLTPHWVPTTIYNLYTFQHSFACRHTITTKNGEPMHCDSPVHPYDFGHIGPGFLPWHRTLLLVWEQLIQQLVPGAEEFVFPYWDWTGDGDKCEVCVNDIGGATNWSDPNGRLDRGSDFYDWDMICQYEYEMNGCRVCNQSRPAGKLTRIPGGNPNVPTLPDQRQEDWTMSRPYYFTDPTDPKRRHLSFSAALEGQINEFGTAEETGKEAMHSQVHLFFKGFMGNVPNAPNDPIFALHHANVDRLFEKWNRKHHVGPFDLPAQGAHPGHNRDASVVPFFPPIPLNGAMTDSRSLGYTYDDLLEEEEEVEAARQAAKKAKATKKKKVKPQPQLYAAQPQSVQPAQSQDTSGGSTAVIALGVIVAALLVVLLVIGVKYAKWKKLAKAAHSEKTSLLYQSLNQ